MDGKTVEEEVQLAAKHFGLITVSKVERGSALAQELMQFVEKCSWYEVKEHIAEMLRNWEFTDWECMFAAIEN